MVLVPVGEHGVTISINGTQRVSDLIRDDTNYNLSESFNTQVYVNGSRRVNTTQNSDDTYNITESLGSTIKVNGSTEGSFSQTSDSTYNVSVSTEPISWGQVAQTSQGDFSPNNWSIQNDGTTRLEIYDDSGYGFGSAQEVTIGSETIDVTNWYAPNNRTRRIHVHSEAGANINWDFNVSSSGMAWTQTQYQPDNVTTQTLQGGKNGSIEYESLKFESSVSQL